MHLIFNALLSSTDECSLGQVAQRIRGALVKVSRPSSLAALLHTLSYEESPQRIWQAFIGDHHLLVTTWANAGLYSVDFGLGGAIRFAEGITPGMDGLVIIKEAPPGIRSLEGDGTETRHSWTESGADVTVHLNADVMERLIKDPALLPVC